MKKILGIDLGSNSIGWCITTFDENDNIKGIEAIGSRSFDNSRDAKSLEPLSVARRLTREASRRNDRLHMRVKYLCKLLKKYKLMPENETDKNFSIRNPYKARALAANKKVCLHSIGRAFFHMNKRRGFKSNRKLDKKQEADSESKGMKGAIDKLSKALGDITLGEYLYERQKQKCGTRMRSERIEKKNSYEMYANREMYEKEFDKIWNTQKKFHPTLTDEAYSEIRDAIFYQRPLKTPERGFCEFETSLHRAYKAYPIFEEFRIWQEVNALQICDISGNMVLTLDDRKAIVEELLTNKSNLAKKDLITFSNIKKKILKLKDGFTFNFESEKRKGFYVAKTNKILSSDDAFGKEFLTFSEAEKEHIIDLLSMGDSSKFESYAKGTLHLSEEKIESILDTALSLEEGTGSLSAEAMHRILPFLKEGQLYYNACTLAGYSFNKKYDGEILDKLPYYGAILHGAILGANPQSDPEKEPEKYFGKITNPSVHVALNQLRKVVNKIIDVYGKPDEIVIETARDLPLGKKGLSELKKEQTKNQKDNERIAEELKALGVANNYSNRMKFKLWEDLNKDPIKRTCPFCGKQIERSELFTPEFEIEHLLPFSETFDDSRANKVISCRACNRYKAKRTPFNAFESTERWNEILSRSAELPKGKQWRFKEDAMERFREGPEGNFIARMLGDTRYMSKIAREYFTCILPTTCIRTIPGILTGKLRAAWGFNAILADKAQEDSNHTDKNRNDHRHHAIDAFVVSVINRKQLASISKYAKLAEDAELENLLKLLPLPFGEATFQILKEKVDNIIVSHKLDRGNVRLAVKNGKTLGHLHKDTVYGKVNVEGVAKGKIALAVRKKLTDLEFNEEEIESIANPKISKELLDILKNSSTEAEWKSALLNYGQKTNIRRVRVHHKNADEKSYISISNKQGKPYKYMQNDEMYCIDIYLPSGSKKWAYHTVNMYEAHKLTIPTWRKNDAHAKLIMRLFKRDTIAYEENGEYKVVVIKKIATNGQIGIIDLNQSNKKSYPTKKPSALQGLNAYKVYVDEIGRIYGLKDPKE